MKSFYKRFILSICLIVFLANVSLKAAERQIQLKTIPVSQIKLLPSIFLNRATLNKNYIMSLRNDNLLRNFYLEAGMWQASFYNSDDDEWEDKDDIHWGWESPTCQVRGHFLGHWLSAAAHIYASTGDLEIKAKADIIVSELAKCQIKNGGEWIGSIPEKYLHWIAQGQRVWAPQYTIHKTFMGLIDMYKMAGNDQALQIAENFAKWFINWTNQFDRTEMDDILDIETGGMLEAWSDVYGITGKEEHLNLIHKYDRSRLFEPLLKGADPLTNRHANTTIPEAHGAARAFEVTGEKRWRDIAEAYWKCAVTDRGYFCTGGQTNGEVWTPPFKYFARLGSTTQEHCTVYNMIRLADYLLRWNGDVSYADYIERNIYNGILAQQHPQTGMISYFLPLHAGAKKGWGSPTKDFWCCHGSLVQAHAFFNKYIYYEEKSGLLVSQYIPSEVKWTFNDVDIKLRQEFDFESTHDHIIHLGDGPQQRPNQLVINFKIDSDQPVNFDLKLRLPWWLSDKPTLLVNGKSEKISSKPSSIFVLNKSWHNDTVRLILPKTVSTSSIPDAPNMIAFMDGPVVLAGLCEEEKILYGAKNNPATILTPHNEREWRRWLYGYRTINQDQNFLFLPLYEVVDEKYTVYFPIRSER